MPGGGPSSGLLQGPDDDGALVRSDGGRHAVGGDRQVGNAANLPIMAGQFLAARGIPQADEAGVVGGKQPPVGSEGEAPQVRPVAPEGSTLRQRVEGPQLDGAGVPQGQRQAGGGESRQ